MLSAEGTDCLLETHVVKAVLFDLGSTLLEFENQPWGDLRIGSGSPV